jgi:Zn-dependent peptidase ImmA (M78 family)
VKPDVEISGFDFLTESLQRLWKPGMEAVKLQLNGDVRSLDDIPSAAEGAGCEISYVDLPEKISGFAQVIDGQPHIVVNRAKPSKHSEFTIAHELGHHVLHSNPLQDGDQANCLTASNVEFEANLFGAALVTAVSTEEERKEMVRHNPEIQLTLAVSVFGMVLAILMALAIWISSVAQTRDAVLIETK